MTYHKVYIHTHFTSSFYIHGWSQAYWQPPGSLLKLAYATLTEQVNYIAIDYSPIAMNPILPIVLAQLPPAAECIKKFVRFLDLPFENSICIGASLGAQLCALTARPFHVFHVIYGCDPPGLMYNYSTREPLNKHDAPYVEGIHTSCLVGTKHPVNTADIYINNGCNQPNCLFINESCNHVNAGFFLAKAIMESINNSLTAKPCTSYEQVRKCNCDENVNDGGKLVIKLGDPDNIHRARGLYQVRFKVRVFGSIVLDRCPF